MSSKYRFIDTYPDTVGDLANEALIPVIVWGRYLLSEAVETTVYISKCLLHGITHCNNKQQ